MEKIGRNDACPCGSGKKYKKCHLGQEENLVTEKIEAYLSELGEKIVALPEAHYGKAKEYLDALPLEELTGKKLGIKFIDWAEYQKISGLPQKSPEESFGASQIINLQKTQKLDPDHIYIAISPDTNDSTLIHQLAHVLSFLRDEVPLPGSMSGISEQTGIPIAQLDHPREFGSWLDYLQKKFNVTLDADDMIISFLNQKNCLFEAEELKAKGAAKLTSRSAEIFRVLQECREEIDGLIKNREGYIGTGNKS